MRYTCLIIALALFSSSCAAAEWTNRNITYAGKQITIVLPAAINLDDPAHDEWLRKFMQPQDEFVAGIYSTDPGYYALIQAKRVTRDLTVTPEQFATASENIQKAAEPSTEFNRELLQKLEAHTKVVAVNEDQEWIKSVIGGTAMLGTIDRSSSHISILQLTAYDMPDGASKKRTLVAASNTLLLVHGKLIMLLFYESFTGHESYQHLKSVTKEAVRRTLAANE